MRGRLAPLLALAMLAGCGGHGGGASSPSAASTTTSVGKGRGKAVIRVQWPARSTGRLIPNAANSIVVRLLKGTTVAASKTIPRPASGGTSTSTTLTGLAYGGYVVSVNAYPTTTGTGVAQATGAGSMTVTEDVPGTVAVAMDSTVASLALVPAAPAVAIGSAAPLAVSATDATGAIVLLAAGSGAESLTWADDAPAVATLAGTGPVATLTGVTAGTAHVAATLRVKDDGTTITSPVALVTVHDAAPYRLAVSGYPKTGGDPGNTGLGGGSGASGRVGWNAWVGSSPVGAIVVGPDGTAYTGAGTAVSAVSPSGAVLWQQTVAGTVKGLLLTTGGRLYVGANLLTALNVADGTVAWAFTTVGACFAPNVLADGTIIQAVPYGVYAIDPDTQAIRWQASFTNLSGAAVATDDTVVLWNSGEVRGLAGATGAQTFSQKEVASVGTVLNRPPPAPAMVVVSPFVRSFGFSAAPSVRGTAVAYPESVFNGKATTTRTYTPGTRPPFTGIYRYTTTYAGTDTSYLWVLSGGTVTSTNLASASASNITGPSVAVPTALAQDASAAVVLAYSGKTTSAQGWSVTEAGSAGASVGSDGTVYLATTDAVGLVEAIDPASGNVRWTATLPAKGVGVRPAIGPDGTVYAGTAEGRLVQIR